LIDLDIIFLLEFSVKCILDAIYISL